MGKSYSEKLKDPRWQKKRLEIFERDGWECQWCGDTKQTLMVHHKTYDGDDPWDCPDNCLVTLCESCHQFEHDARPDAEESLLNALREIGFMTQEVTRLARGFRNSAFPSDLDLPKTPEWRHLPTPTSTVLQWVLQDPTTMFELFKIYFSNLAKAA